MPLYEYKCLKCGRNTEKIEGVSGPYLKKCPHCGGKVESVITAPSIQFKGAGWYVTDYGGKKPGASSGDGEKTDKSASSDRSAAETKESGSKDKDSGSKEATSKDTKKSEEKKLAKKSSSSEK